MRQLGVLKFILVVFFNFFGFGGFLDRNINFVYGQDLDLGWFVCCLRGKWCEVDSIVLSKEVLGNFSFFFLNKSL